MVSQQKLALAVTDSYLVTIAISEAVGFVLLSASWDVLRMRTRREGCNDFLVVLRLQAATA